MRRIGFKYSAACGEKLVEVLRAKGPNATVDIDEVFLVVLHVEHHLCCLRQCLSRGEHTGTTCVSILNIVSYADRRA